jgi:hypothetical protein
MPFINHDWLSEDEHAEQIISSGADVTAYDASTDRELIILANSVGIHSTKIPVDEDGFVTSAVMQQYGITYMTMRLFRGYWGKRFGENDIYYEKMKYMSQDLERIAKMITAGSIIGTEDDEGNVISPEDLVQDTVMIV